MVTASSDSDFAPPNINLSSSRPTHKSAHYYNKMPASAGALRSTMPLFRCAGMASARPILSQPAARTMAVAAKNTFLPSSAPSSPIRLSLSPPAPTFVPRSMSHARWYATDRAETAEYRLNHTMVVSGRVSDRKARVWCGSQQN